MLEEHKESLESFIDDLLQQVEKKDPMNKILCRAMKYVLGSGGKRVRALILLHIAKVLEVKFEYAIVAAAALEIIHNYTLVHDDLPGMDNDEIRRGLPTCHMKFNEGIAILTGNALFTLALQILLDGLQNDLVPKVLQIILSSSGFCGVLSGQASDLEMKLQNKNTIVGLSSKDDVVPVLQMFYLKTGKLFEAAFTIPSILAGLDSKQEEILAECGGIFGVLYQITDDVEDLGKNDIITQNVRNTLVETFNSCLYKVERIVGKGKMDFLRKMV